MKKLGFALHTASPKCYRLLREFLPFPSVPTITDCLGPEKTLLTRTLMEDDRGLVSELLKEYRRCSNIDDNVFVSCTLAFDALSVSQTGVKVTNMCSEYSFGFVLPPLNHTLPDLLIRSVPHGTGRIDDRILKMRDELCVVLEENRFRCHFIATDGDTGVSDAHKQAFALYSDAPVDEDLENIVNHIVKNDAEVLKHWPISDLLHLMRNARARIAMGRLAFDSGCWQITGDGLGEILDMEKVFTAHGSLDLLKDELALATFTLDS
jgi:hypothetical protein